jgi:hypothetical protein
MNDAPATIAARNADASSSGEVATARARTSVAPVIAVRARTSAAVATAGSVSAG